MVSHTQDSAPTARPDVELRRVGSEWVLFDARRDRAHVLNLTAAVIWTYCDGAHPSEAIAAEIATEVIEARPERLQSDIEQALQRFAAEGLLQ